MESKEKQVKLATFALGAVLVALGGCAPPAPQDRVVDQCLRHQYFEECLKTVPPGPSATHYNDWDDVVEACGSQAYYMALRPHAAVKPECNIDN